MSANEVCSTVRFQLKVTLLEDLHVGSGLGGAGIDALLRRDRNGQPVIRWSHFKGLLIEALHERESALSSPLEKTAELARRLFGGPGLSARGRVRGRGFRLTSNSTVTTLVWTSTAREKTSRVPLDETMRHVEFIGAGASFGGELQLSTRASERDDAAYVSRLIQRVHRIGGKRSRGAGLVHIEVERVDVEPRRPATPSARPRPGAEGHGKVDVEWRVLIQALDPLCLAATGTPGNLIPSHSHMTPRTVHGMFTRWALETGRAQLADALLRGRISCGAAYPLGFLHDGGSAETADAVPYPLSLQHPKPAGQIGELPWWATTSVPVTPQETLSATGRTDEKLKRPDAHDYVVTRDGKTWVRFHCPLGITQRNDSGHSRRTRGKQQLFAQEEVPEDIIFVARLASDGVAKPLLQEALTALAEDQSWLQVGRGGAPATVKSWQALLSNEKPAEVKTNELRLFVETDLILRQRAGGILFHDRLDGPAIDALLSSASSSTVGLQRVDHVSEPVEVRGFNAATGLPRLPAVAIRRGSVALLRFDTTENARACAAGLWTFRFTGVGERTSEGHGRIRISFAPVEERTTSDGAADSPPRNAAEDRLAAVLALMNGTDFPKDFPAGRWQALRQAAGDASLLKVWFLQSRRASGKKGAAPAVLRWLNHLESKRTDAALLRDLGLQAAKRAQAEGKQERRVGLSGGERAA